MIKNYILFFILTLLIFSCGPSKHYRLASEANTTEAYKTFIKKYPKSDEAIYARAKLKAIYDLEAYQTAKRINTTNSYRKYLTDFPKGKYLEDANNAILNIQKREKEEKEKSDWTLTLNENTIAAYQRFLKLHPNSKFSTNARNKISEIEKIEWNKVLAINTIDKYESFIKSFPTNTYVQEARRRIKQLEEEKYILPLWNKALRINTYQAYREFYNSYKSSSFGYLAKSKMDSFDASAWNTAKASNSIPAYQRYVNSFPLGNYVEDANKKIIDLEVENIFKGDYGYLPPMTKKSNYNFGTSRPTSNKINIINNTSYTLTVWYSGSDSKKIVLSPEQSSSFELKNGSYKVAASVNASNVTKYAGNERLDGGDYESKFYIETKRSFNNFY